MDRARVFLVFDDRTTLGVLAAFVRRMGYRVQAFTDPEEAGRALRDGVPHVLVIDRAEPGMAGATLALEALRADPNLEVVRVSVGSDGHFGSARLDPGTPPTLSHPLVPDQLARVLRDSASRRGARAN